jgi:filamentous hemagglutinin family protein
MKIYRAFLTFSVFLIPNISHAQAVTDGSVGAVQSLSSHFTVPQSLGSTTGNNLFHSFKTFNINTGESATFTGANNILNVICRVTGGDVSTINGALRSQVGKANFYFINPSGVVFGSNAQVDVPAAFHVSTIDNLKLSDGSNFTVNTPANSLSIASPDSFGLVASSVSNNSLLAFNGAVLSVNNAQQIELVAGKINLNSQAALSANEGNIKLTAPQIDITNATISANTDSTENAGNIDIQTTNLSLMDGAKMSADSNGAGKSGIVTVNAKDSLNIQNGALISSNSNAQGDGGAVTINTQALHLDGKNTNEFTGIAANATGSGQAGQVNVRATSVNIENGAEINSSTFGEGSANAVTLITQDLTIDGKNNTAGATGIGSNANPNSKGNAGNIAITANTIRLINGGEINASTSGLGNAGHIQVDATSIAIDGQNNQTQVTGIHSDTSAVTAGKGGEVDVNANLLTIANTGTIGSNSFGSGDAGAVKVDANTIDINGHGSADNLFTGISSNALAQGDAGKVSVSAEKLILTEKGRITSNTNADGNAGDVNVFAKRIDIDGNNNGTYTGIASNTYTGKGNAGTVNVNAPLINITNAGRITTNTRGSGKAGNLNIQANTLNIDAQHSDYLAGISSAASPESTGQVGNIHIIAKHQITLRNDAQISIQNRATMPSGQPTPSGEITITTPNLSINNGLINAKATDNADASNITLHIANALKMHLGDISTQANTGNGGAITINDGSVIDLQRSSITTSVASSTGNGGDITMTSPAMVLDNGMIQANAYSGNGGDVLVNVDSLIASQNQLIKGGAQPIKWNSNVPGLNVIQAASQFGLSGNVHVTSPQLNLSGVLIGLNTVFFGRELLSQDYCNVGTGSSLTVRGQGVLPSKSSDLLY